MSSTEEVIILARLTGTREVVANAEAMGLAIEELGVETEATGTAMKVTTERSWAMNQALFTLRRLTYGVSLALIAGGVEAFKWGFQYNEAMKEATISLSRMLPSQQAVNDELHTLFQMAKFSPFQFKDLTIAFRNMYMGMSTLGISAATVNTTMQSIIDTLAAAGRSSPAALNRVAYALQHMAYQGRLTGQTVNQLGRDGIPVAAILRKEFGLTGEQIHNVGKLGIPVLEFLQAFNRYAKENPAIMGAAQRQAMGSWSGLFAQFRDSMSQIMGAVTQGFFNHSIKMLQDLNKRFSDAGDALSHASNATQVIRQLAPSFLPVWQALSSAIHQLWVDFSALIKGLTQNQTIWATITTAFWAIYTVLWLITPLLKTSQYWLTLLVPLWIAYKIAQMGAAFWTGVTAFETAVLSGEFEALTFWQFLAALVTGRFAIAEKIAAAATWLYVAAEAALIAVTEDLTVSMLALGIVLMANPIFLIIGLIVLLIATLVILYFKWKWFHNLVNDTYEWIKSHWMLVGYLLLGPFFLFYAWIITHFQMVKRIIMDVVDWIKKQVDKLEGWFHKITGWFSWLWGGGGTPTATITQGGTHIMYGPSGLALPTPHHVSASGQIQVTPKFQGFQNIHTPFNFQEAWQKPKQPIHVDVKLNKKVLASAVADVELDNLARS
jgi:tape measure domain-containing protein